MPVARPEVGELVKTVVELVDAVNAGGGGSTDLSAYVGNVDLTASERDIRITNNGDGNGILLVTNTDFAELSIAAVGGPNATLILNTSGILTLQSEVGILVNGGTSNSAFILNMNSGNENITVSPDNIDIKTAAGDGARIQLNENSLSLEATAEDGFVTIGAENTNGGIELRTEAVNGSLSFNSPKIGFFGSGPAPRPQVPLTTPDVQDIIDALVQLGLVTQSD